MIYDANDNGSSEFSDIFNSVSNEKKQRDEAIELQRMAGLLDRIATEEETRRDSKLTEEKKMPRMPRELLKVDPEGNIDNKHRSAPRVDRKKVHTIDDLPKESLYDSLFSGHEDLDDAMKVESGRRLHDGKLFHHAYVNDPVKGKLSIIEWTGFSYEMLVIIGAIVLFTGMLLVRSLVSWILRRGLQRKRSREEQEHEFERAVERAMEKRFALLSRAQPTQGQNTPVVLENRFP